MSWDVKNGVWIVHRDYSIAISFSRPIEKITTRQAIKRGLESTTDPRNVICSLDHYVNIGGKHRAIGRSIRGPIKVPSRAKAVVLGKPVFEEHAPRITKNSYLMCVTCQKVCPYGQEKRGLNP